MTFFLITYRSKKVIYIFLNQVKCSWFEVTLFLNGPCCPAGPGGPGASGPAGPGCPGASGPGGPGVSGPGGPGVSGPGRCEQRQFSAVSHGAPAPPRLGLFSGWCCSSLQSRGKSGAHVSTSRASPGRCIVNVIPKKPRCSFEERFYFLFAGPSSEAAGFCVTAETRGRSSAPAALTLANVIINDDRVQSANSVSNHLIISGDLLA